MTFENSLHAEEARKNLHLSSMDGRTIEVSLFVQGHNLAFVMQVNAATPRPGGASRGRGSGGGGGKLRILVFEGVHHIVIEFSSLPTIFLFVVFSFFMSPTLLYVMCNFKGVAGVTGACHLPPAMEDIGEVGQAAAGLNNRPHSHQ